jgi:hypothetical protein
MSTRNEFEGPDKSAARPPGAHTLFSRRSWRTKVVVIVTVVAIGTIALFYVFRHSGSSLPNAVQLTLGLPHGITTRGLWRVPVDGGEELRVLDSSKSELGVVVDDGIYFINPDAKDEVVMEFFDFATRKERRVAGLGKLNILPFCIAVSPDRRQILYTQNDQTGADIMLVENFR